MTRIATAFVLFALAGSALADDRVPLQADPVLERDLRIVAQGHYVRKYCDDVSMRLFKALGLMTSLKSRARALGYSSDEAQAYFDDKSQKARVEAAARADLEALGANFSTPRTICTVARAQIAAKSGVGQYFYVN